MRIIFRLEFEDYYDAAQARSARDRRVRQVAVLAVVALLLVAWMRAGNSRGGYVYVLLALLLLLSIPLAQWVSKRSFLNALRKDASTGPNREFSVEISKEGIQSADSAYRDDWSHFSKYSESNGAFILYQEDSISAILPKRAFDVDGADGFRRLVEAKLPRF